MECGPCLLLFWLDFKIGSILKSSVSVLITHAVKRNAIRTIVDAKDWAIQRQKSFSIGNFVCVDMTAIESVVAIGITKQQQRSVFLGHNQVSIFIERSAN